jgi:hypothetical protein
LKGALILAFGAGPLASVGVFMAALTGVGAVIAGVIAAAYLLYKNWAEIGPKLKAAWQPVADWLNNSFGEALRSVWKGVEDGWDNLVAKVKSGWSSVVNTFKTNEVKDAIGDFGDIADNFSPIIRAIGDLGGAIARLSGSAIGAFLQEVLQAFSGLARAVTPVLDAFNSLPGAAQTAIMALGLVGFAMIRLRGHMAQTAASGAGMIGMLGRLALMRNVAGGLGAITVAMGGMADQGSTTGKVLSGVASVGGGALLGFAAGGPIGAAIGAGIGGLTLLAGAADKAAGSAEAFKANWEGVAATLDQVTGATTEATRAYVYDEAMRTGLIDSMAQLGISSRTVVDGLLGQKDAMRELSQAEHILQANYGDHSRALAELKTQYDNVARGKGEHVADRLYGDQIKKLE